MVKYKALQGSVAEVRDYENMKADVERNKAYNDYIAMMCDVELPEGEDESMAEGERNA